MNLTPSEINAILNMCPITGEPRDDGKCVQCDFEYDAECQWGKATVEDIKKLKAQNWSAQ
jgi:hypothetical protein